MQGQWRGNFQGTNVGDVRVDLDDRGDHWAGTAYIMDRPNVPSIRSIFRTNDKSPRQNLRVGYAAIDPISSAEITPDQIAKIFPGVSMPQFIDIDLDWKGSRLKATYRSPVGTSGTANLTLSNANRKSAYRPDRSVKTWDKFRAMASRLQAGRYIFRGQSEPFRLRTSFHRTQRKDLTHFIRHDMPALQTEIVAQTEKFINLADQNLYAAFIHMIQHHGYPTPLLDWSRSPFVAAYFAFAPGGNRISKKVRILMFDAREWENDFEQIRLIAPMRMHFSTLYPFAVENKRSTPQQALSTITNLDDIESYIREREIERGKTYLKVFDLPFIEKEVVRNDIRMMGITAASLFPGIDGITQHMRAVNFGYSDS